MIAALIRWSARNLVLVLLGAAFLTAAGISSVRQVPLAATPDLSDPHVIMIDSHASRLSDIADVILPGATFAEKGGTFENVHGLLQAFNPSIPVVQSAKTEGQIAEDLREMEVQVDVDEADIGELREGQPATFTVDAYPDSTFVGTVEMVRYGSEVVSNVVTYKVILATENAALLLRPGMTATADITVREVSDALLVPNAALRFTPAAEPVADSRSLLSRILPGRPPFRAASRDEGEGRTVWVLRDGVPEAVSVETGASDGVRTQITGGDLETGDRVIVDSETTAH